MRAVIWNPQLIIILVLLIITAPQSVCPEYSCATRPQAVRQVGQCQVPKSARFPFCVAVAADTAADKLYFHD